MSGEEEIAPARLDGSPTRLSGRIKRLLKGSGVVGSSVAFCAVIAHGINVRLSKERGRRKHHREDGKGWS